MQQIRPLPGGIYHIRAVTIPAAIVCPAWRIVILPSSFESLYNSRQIGRMTLITTTPLLCFPRYLIMTKRPKETCHHLYKLTNSIRMLNQVSSLKKYIYITRVRKCNEPRFLANNFACASVEFREQLSKMCLFTYGLHMQDDRTTLNDRHVNVENDNLPMKCGMEIEN